jgi:hypothetical protein
MENPLGELSLGKGIHRLLRIADGRKTDQRIGGSFHRRSPLRNTSRDVPEVAERTVWWASH